MIKLPLSIKKYILYFLTMSLFISGVSILTQFTFIDFYMSLPSFILIISDLSILLANIIFLVISSLLLCKLISKKLYFSEDKDGNVSIKTIK